MNYSRQRADPRQHLVGISFVFLLHVLVVYVLVTGLGKKVIDVIRAPIDTRVIEEIKKPPPPQEMLPPPPKLEAPPPPYVPPPEVQIAAPPPVQAVITATPTPPPAATTITPMAPAAPPAPRAGPVSAAAHCSKMALPEAPGLDFAGKISLTMRATIRGNKLVQADLVAGSLTGATDRKTQRLLVNAVTSAMLAYTCSGDNIVVEQQFDFSY